jgi:hypothetical protein
VKDNLHLQCDWHPVVGELVEIRRDNQVVRTGAVEAVTSDDGILWIAAEGAERRTLYERAQGYSVWIKYKWENAPAR